jgi:glycosidase
MSWSAGAGHGFTSVTPWLGFASDAGARNVAEQTDDGRSVLEFYRALLRLRGSSRALRLGHYASVDAADGVFAYTRRVEDATVVVALNMSNRAVDTAVSVPGAPALARRVALGTHRRPQEPVDPGRLGLRPFEGVVIA